MHSDINVNGFLIQIMPECFAPTDLFVKKIFDTNAPTVKGYRPK